MKQYARILLLLIIVFFLCSCGHQPSDGSTTSSSNDNPVFSGKKSEPSSEQLHTDMQDSLTLYHSGNYGYNVSICEYEVERSMTEDTSYTARFKVIAQSTYADFHYTANVEYTRYDQGWMIDQCDWTLATYEVTRYPNEEEIQLMKEQQGVQYSTELKVVTEGEHLVYYGKMISQWNQFIITEYDISVAWVFDLYSDSWLFETQTSNDEKFEFTKSLEGTWNLSEEDYLSKGSIGYFSQNLRWNIDIDDFDDIEDISYDFEAEDIGLKEEAFAKISSLRQLQPLVDLAFLLTSILMAT